MKLNSFLIGLLALIATRAGAQTPLTIPLWEKGAPGFERLKDEPEIAKDWYVKHINNPSIQVYLPPKEIANGTAVIIAPGGGHSSLVINPEGRDPARYLNKLGITAIVLKYRLEREPGSPYKITVHARQDGYRAIRLVRSRAKEFGIDPNRIGVLGFSAGGEVTMLVSYDPAPGNPQAADPVEKLDGRPNFQMLIYPGPIGLPAVVPADAPPTFMVVSNDDGGHSDVIVDLIPKYRAARVPLEVHLYQQGGHGYNLGDRSKLDSIRAWPQRMADWLKDCGYLTPSGH